MTHHNEDLMTQEEARQVLGIIKTYWDRLDEVEQHRLTDVLFGRYEMDWDEWLNPDTRLYLPVDLMDRVYSYPNEKKDGK